MRLFLEVQGPRRAALPAAAVSAVTQFLADLGVIPTVSPDTLRFTEWVQNLLPTPGAPAQPDLLTQPAATATYLGGVRDTAIAGSKIKPLIRVTDGNVENMWELVGEVQGSVEELMEDTGKATVNIKWAHWIKDLLINDTLAVEDLNLLIDWDPLNPNWRRRWGGKITEIHIKRDDKGIHSIELTALHFREHAKRLLVAANPIFPPEIQLPRMWVLPGPTRTILAATSFINLARLFMPGLSTITNIFNPAGWLNPLSPDAYENILPTSWPIQVAFVDTGLDQSRWSSVGATWTTWHESYKDLLTDAGCAMKTYVYLTTDEDSPNVELASLLSLAPDILAGLLGIDVSLVDAAVAKLAAPTRNAVVFAFEQHDGVTGPTGTVADGFLDTVAVTLDDLITPFAIDLNTGDTYDPGRVLNGEPVQDASGIDHTYLIEQLLGVAPDPPAVIWWDGTYNGLVNTDLTWHKGAVKTIMTGSKSPVIVNEAITFAIRYGLAELSSVINLYLGIWSGGQQQVPGTPGLDNLYQEQLSNTLLAWQRFTDPIRALYAGDMAWQEHFERGSGTAYTLASILTLRDGDWKTRAFAAFKAETLNGHPWIADLDYALADRVGFEHDSVIYVDNVYAIKRVWSWDQALTVTVKIGEDKEKSDPFHAAFKTMANIYGFAGQLAGEGTIFEG
jgi:hypothetical protein